MFTAIFRSIQRYKQDMNDINFFYLYVVYSYVWHYNKAHKGCLNIGATAIFWYIEQYNKIQNAIQIYLMRHLLICWTDLRILNADWSFFCNIKQYK